MRDGADVIVCSTDEVFGQRTVDPPHQVVVVQVAVDTLGLSLAP